MKKFVLMSCLFAFIAGSALTSCETKKEAPKHHKKSEHATRKAKGY